MTRFNQPLSILMAEAQSCAEVQLRELGILHTTMLASCPKGSFIMIPSAVPDHESFSGFLTLFQKLCVAHAAKVAVLISQVQTSKAELADLKGLSRVGHGSDAPTDHVVLKGESVSDCDSVLLPVLRGNDSRFLGLGPATDCGTVLAGCRNLISSAVATPSERAAARMWLSAHGFGSATRLQPMERLGFASIHTEMIRAMKAFYSQG